MTQSELCKANAKLLSSQASRAATAKSVIKAYKREMRAKDYHIAWLNEQLICERLAVDAREQEIKELRYRIESLEK